MKHITPQTSPDELMVLATYVPCDAEQCDLDINKLYHIFLKWDTYIY